MDQVLSPVQSGTTANNVIGVTRSGRLVKKPVRYEPVEQVEDDYATDDYDTDVSKSVSSEVSYDESEEVSSEEDADEDGNLDGFVVADKSESDSDDSNGPSTAVPVKKRPVSRK